MQKRISRVGNCDGIIFDRVMKEISGIKAKDMVNLECSKNKIIITKVGE